ncbi:MAG: CD225/dispanin family protein [Prevotellaceae bacterium]|jgi:hypothetical protein|nr:CD225/dispanin family protein [Prevotellaceae bacterium]
MDYFYLDKNNQQQGPVPANELSKHGLTPDTKVWKQGMSGWQKAGDVSELSGIFPPPAPQSATPPPPPPPPPVSVAPPPPPKVTPPPCQETNAQQAQKPDNLLVWSILSTVLCCLPTGIVAIVYSNKVDKLWYIRDYTASQEAANTAKIWCFASLGLGVIWQICLWAFGLLSVITEALY